MGGCIGKKNNIVITKMSNKTNYYDEFRIKKRKSDIIEKESEKSKFLLSDICKDLKVTIIQTDEKDDINNIDSFREILTYLN